MLPLPDRTEPIRQLLLSTMTPESFPSPNPDHEGPWLRSLPRPWCCISIQAVQWTSKPTVQTQRRPQLMPFLWSCHVQSQDGRVSHGAFFDISGADSRRRFALTLLRILGPTGTVFSWNAAFDRRCLGELAELFPELAAALAAVQSRLIELATITCQAIVPKQRDLHTTLGLAAFRQLVHPDTPSMVRHGLYSRWSQQHRNRTEAMLGTARWLAGVSNLRDFWPERLSAPTLRTEVPQHLQLLFDVLQELLMCRFTSTGKPSFPASIAWLQRQLHGGYSATRALLAWLEDAGIIQRHYGWSQIPVA